MERERERETSSVCPMPGGKKVTLRHVSSKDCWGGPVSSPLQGPASPPPPGQRMGQSQLEAGQHPPPHGLLHPEIDRARDQTL
jgi:hypothetical protein